MSNEFLIKKKVSDLSERWLTNISETFYSEEVSIVRDSTRKNTTRELIDFMNERFVRAQLELINQPADNRGTWYVVSHRLKGIIDLSGSKDQQYISFLKTIKDYCKKLTDFYNVPYWGYVMDELNIKSKARAIAYDLNLKGTLLDVETIEDFKNEAFFIVICEKDEVLKSTMRAIRSKGYTNGWMGIVTEGYATTNVVRLLMDYKKHVQDKFYVFILHDWDIDGLKIFFDIKRYFPCESAGLNNELIDYCGNVDKSLLLESYKSTDGKAKKAQILGSKSMLKELKDMNIINDERFKEYTKWINYCIEHRAELNALTAIRLEKNKELNPARDFADYIEHLLEDVERFYDLNRYDVPNWGWRDFQTPALDSCVPGVIQTIKDEIFDMLTSKLDEYLMDYEDEGYWKDLVSEVYIAAEKYIYGSGNRKENIMKNTKDEMIEDNKEYNESLKNVRKFISEQSSTLENKRWRKESILKKGVSQIDEVIREHIEGTSEYAEVESTLDDFKSSMEDLLDNI